MNNVADLYDAELVDAPPQLPEGKYSALYIGHETAYIFTQPKVFIHFRLHGGQYHGTRIYGAYRVRALKGKPGKGGAFKLRHSMKLYREIVVLAGQHARPDRVSLQSLKNVLLRVRVRTVHCDARQRPLPPACEYSVVAEMLAVEAGTP